MTIQTIQGISLLVPILTGIFWYFEKRNKKYDTFVEQYFIKVVNVYVEKWKENQKVDPIKFINKKLEKSVKNNSFYIPKYISYLVNKNDKESLHKVLITDYIKNYPNRINEKWKTANNISECANAILLFFSIILLSASLVMIVPSCFIWFFDCVLRQAEETRTYIVSIFFGMIMLAVSIWLIISAREYETDYYSLKIKRIRGYIKQKVNYYEKNSSKFFI